jgi:hypothetical protein
MLKDKEKLRIPPSFQFEFGGSALANGSTPASFLPMKARPTGDHPTPREGKPRVFLPQHACCGTLLPYSFFGGQHFTAGTPGLFFFPHNPAAAALLRRKGAE